MSSRYERQRALNVVRNQGVLRDLGLGLHGMEPTTTATKPRTASSGKKKMANAVAAAAAPLRRSRRGQQLEPELKGVRDVAIDAPRNASMESARHAPDTGAHKPKRRKMEGATDPVVRRKVRTPKTSVIRPVAPQSPSQTEVHPSPNPHPKNENPPRRSLVGPSHGRRRRTMAWGLVSSFHLNRFPRTVLSDCPARRWARRSRWRRRRLRRWEAVGAAAAAATARDASKWLALTRTPWATGCSLATAPTA